MRKLILALVLTTALCLALAAVAAADPGSIQVSGQSATTQQQAGAASSATQVDPSNTNVSVRVLSPGDDGSVSQSNTAGSSASAGNQAGTTQTAGQTAGGSGIQTSQQQAGTDQLALALSAADQAGASNANLPVRVLSPGDDGSVTQGNTVGSQATSGNAATTGQSANQGQSSACSCSGSGSGIQTADQSAGTGQSSDAASTATQVDPSNTTVSIRVLSPGDDGSVSQNNTVGSQATSGNTATTGQTSTQNQSGPSCGCSGSGSGIQTANQSAGTEQESGALSTAKQDHPSNTNVSIRVLSPGDDGSVSQANTVTSSATSGNSASTKQDATQTQAGHGCGCGTTPVQQAKQDAGTGQSAGGLSGAGQQDAANGDSPTDVASPSSGGAVNQSNSAGSSANAGNSASTGQNASQNASGTGIQTSDQSAGTDQSAIALSSAKQIDPSNTAGSIRVLSPGDDGSVTQANTVGSTATSGNSASTTQSSNQAQGSSCGCSQPIWSDAVAPSTSSPAIQVAGQQASTSQGSLAGSAAVQVGASNTASPVRVLSPGGGGNVSQSNTAGSSATSGNAATTTQTSDQAAAGRSCGCGSAIQVAGQKAHTDQGSLALSGALQVFGHGKSDCECGGGKPSGNVASPVRVGSYGSDGNVTQSNTVGSSATSGNTASTTQDAEQGANGPAIQVIGQDAWTSQASFAASLAAQFGASNVASPVRVKSPGGGASVSQQNTAGSSATSGNAADTAQQGSQYAGSSKCGCSSAPIQVLGQRAGTSQLAKALSAAFQFAPSNDFSPVRVWSRGGGGSVWQGNTSSSRGDSGNRAGTAGEAMQAS
jgi:hypothetical protein